MSVFKVGDVVEVLQPRKNRGPIEDAERAAWVGRILVVVRVAPALLPWDGISVYTAPSGTKRATRNGWNPISLRKIDPPDWEAPQMTETERDFSLST